MHRILFTLMCIIVHKTQHCQTKKVEKYHSRNLVFWNEWTSCKGRCGETGFMSRYRGNITSSVVQSCELNREWKTCRVLGCTMANYTESVEGNELRTRELNYIKKNLKTVNRGILKKCMSDDHCDYHTVKSVFANDTTQLWNAFLCVKYALGCPVKGGWGEWNPWSKCTATCGPGIQYRLRNCDHPKPSRTSLNCTGHYVEFKNCFGKLCATKINGTWCKWSNWSKCSVRQGNGIVIRKRFCRHLDKSLKTSCYGSHTEIGQCYRPNVDGGWSEWQKWSPCSEKCDKGVRYRMRSCSRPEPKGFGQECTGEYVQAGACHVEPCKGPPIMVATFNKKSQIKYAITEVNITLLHVTMRFYPFDMSSILLRRFYDNCDDCNSVQLNFIDTRLFLTTILGRHKTILQSPSPVNIGWNEVIFTITKNKITLRLNNDEISKYINIGTSIENLNQIMVIGKDFEGFVEKLYVNFIPYALTLNNKFSDMYLPYSTFNTIFELSEEQSYMNLSETVKIHCPQISVFWMLELYLRFEFLSYGNLVSMKSVTADYMLVEIDKDVLKLKVRLDNYFDEVSIKFEEIDSCWIHVEIEQRLNSWSVAVNGEKRTLIMPTDVLVELCDNHFYIGNLKDTQNSTELRGIIGYLKLNDDILNTNDFLMSRSNNKDTKIHNFSGVDASYNEVTMTNKEDQVKLHCIVNVEIHHKDLDITWFKSNDPILHEVVDCNMSNNCFIISNNHVSQITLLSEAIHEDYFYLCVSKTKQKIICIYGVKTFKNNINTKNNVTSKFVFFGKLIVTITILCLIFIVKKIK